jgi:hypothetical protein
VSGRRGSLVRKMTRGGICMMRFCDPAIEIAGTSPAMTAGGLAHIEFQ